MKKLWLVVPVLALAFSSTVARADAKILSFQLGALTTFGTPSNSFSAQAAWTPIFELGPLGVRGEVGISPVKDALGGSAMLTNYEAFVRFGIAPAVSFEVGGGFKKQGSSSLNGCLSGGLAIGLAALLDRIYATYSRILPGGGSNEIRFGLGIVF